MRTITKAIVPVAGKGTRVMPLTLHQPKAMIGIVDKPMIHYIIDELLFAGITTIILVISPEQLSFKKYIKFLAKDSEWQKAGLSIRFAVQKKPRGNGHAILVGSKYLTRNEPVVAVFPDDMVHFRQSPLNAMRKLYMQKKSPIFAIEKVQRKFISQKGIIKTGSCNKDTCSVLDIIEKPQPSKAPSNLGIVGRYILPYSVLNYIRIVDRQMKKAGVETYLTDALRSHMREHGQAHGLLFKGEMFDAGSKIGLLKAQAYFGLHHPEFKKEFKRYITSLYPPSGGKKDKKR